MPPGKQTPQGSSLEFFPQVYKWGLSTDVALSTGSAVGFSVDPSCSGVSDALGPDRQGKGRFK